MPPAWMEEAICSTVDPDLFFPNKGGDMAGLRRVKAICAHCPVIAQCRAYALDDSSLVGIWGGTTVEERKQIRRSGGRCANGHVLAVVGVHERDGCMECRRQRLARYDRERERRQRACSVEGCESRVRARGTCRRHDPAKREAEGKRLAAAVLGAAKALRAAMPNDDPVEVVTRRLEVMGVPA